MGDLEEPARRQDSSLNYAPMKQKLACALILFLAVVIRFYNLSGQSLWADEGNSIALARRSFAEITQRTAFDIHPPLYYWLLKVWITLFGDTEVGLRSLSAVLGVGLVYLIWVLGAQLFSQRVGLTAALLAALSPLQVYYAQEARMYMLLAVLSSLTVLAALLIVETSPQHRRWLNLVYIFIVTAGLYTHYAYPLILIVVNLVALIWFWQQKKSLTPLRISNPPFSNWFIIHLIPLLLYLPWLPTAWRQLATWPSESQPLSLPAILATISTTLLFGLSWPYNLGAVAAITLGFVFILNLTFYALRFTDYAPRTTHYALLLLWLLLPILLTSLIFSPAFLKFLLVATPAMVLLLAVVIEQLASAFRQKHPGHLLAGALLMGLTSLSGLSLYHYFVDSRFARDDYRGIVQFIKSVAGTKDAVILNAEGQQDVFNYYYQRGNSLAPPVYPLPRWRPLDEATTLAELEQIAGSANRIYGVYWATQQADPAGVIENWLNTHLFKATDRWYGNVRLASYASPQVSSHLFLNPALVKLGQDIHLTGYALSPAQVRPGDILQVVLQWETKTQLNVDYVVFLQLLDQQNHVVGQRDAQPQPPTSTWLMNKATLNQHGLFIEPGTPPGKHRLIVGLYDPATGQRLPLKEQGTGLEEQDFIELDQIEVIHSPTALPLGAFDIQVPLHTSLLELSLLGYDFYKLGHRSVPDRPLRSGDAVQLVVYWRLEQPARLLKDQLSIRVVTNNGENTPISAAYPLAGTAYPISSWQTGEIVRAQYDFFLSDLKPGNYRLALSVEGETLEQQSEVLTKPFRVEAAP